LTSGSFADTAPYQRIVSDTRRVKIVSDRPTNYSVAVRPLQNKQPVGSPIISTVVSGGGGVSPQEQDLFDGEITMETYRAKSMGD